MNSTVGLAMLKSLVGADQLAQMEQLMAALMKALVTIEQSSQLLKRIDSRLAAYEDDPITPDEPLPPLLPFED